MCRYIILSQDPIQLDIIENLYFFIYFIIKQNIMDNFQHHVSSSERFTAEEVFRIK